MKLVPKTIRNLRISMGITLVALSVLSGVALWTFQGRPNSPGSEDNKPLEDLKDFGEVPDFTLTEKDGQDLSLSDLKGKIWIVNFIYTNCPDTCPIQSAQMRQIQDEFKNERELRLVSITVDPERDTPQVLSEYANRFSADPARWLFLTGEIKTIHKLAQQGFRLSAAEIPHEERPPSGATHTHSPRFVMIDRGARIRGYYVSTDEEAIKRLRRDIKILLRDEK